MPLQVAVLAAVLLGLAAGSFAGVLVHRVPGGDSIGGRSRCDACSRVLGARDLVPVVSWLASRGRCRTCGASVTARWTLLELGSAGLVAASVLVLGSTPRAAFAGAFLVVLLALTVIDLDHHRLPNAIVYPAAVVALAAIAVLDAAGPEISLVGGLIGACAFGGTLLVIALASRGGMGFGDVKLAGLIGLVVGSIDLASVFVAAGAAILFGGVAAIVALLRGADRRTALPFGPMLAAGALVALFWGPALADLYLGLLR